MKENRAEQEVRNALKIAKTNKFIGAVCLIALGLVLFVWSDTAINMICKVIAALIAVVGIAVVIAFFFGRSRVYGSSAGLFGGVTMLVMGMYLFFRPEVLASLVPTIIGLIVLVTGLVDLSESIRIARQKSGGATAAVVIAALEIILGVVFVIHPMFIENILMKLMAVVLVADGVSDIWIMFQLGKAEKPLEAVAAVARGEYEEGVVTPLSSPSAAAGAGDPSEGYTTIPRHGSVSADAAAKETDAVAPATTDTEPARDVTGDEASAPQQRTKEPQNDIAADAADAGVHLN